MQIAREDFIGALAARETKGGVAFNAGFLYVSSEAGLEIYDLRNVRAGGTAPILVSRTPGLRYHRLAVSGNMLAALYPGHRPAVLRERHGQLDLLQPDRHLQRRQSARAGRASARSRRSSIRSAATTTSPSTSASWSPPATAAPSPGTSRNPAAPTLIAAASQSRAPSWSATARTSSASATTTSIITYTFTPTAGDAFFTRSRYHSTANLQVERANPIVFHPQAVVRRSQRPADHDDRRARLPDAPAGAHDRLRRLRLRHRHARRPRSARSTSRSRTRRATR